MKNQTKNPVKKYMHKSCKPSVEQSKRDAKFLKLLDEEINQEKITPIPGDLFEAMDCIKEKANANKIAEKAQLMGDLEAYSIVPCDDGLNDVGCSSISID